MDSLQFQDFTGTGGAGDFFAPDRGLASPQQSKPNVSGNLLDTGTSAAPQPNDPTQPQKPHFLSFGYYQRFFDIDQDQVFARLLNSAVPRRTGNFIADFVQPNPDLWGPFWVCVTLVFSIAIAGNFARFLQTYGVEGTEFAGSDFSFVTGATSLVFGYALLLPSLVYAFLWYRRLTGIQYSFFDLLCAYGYSLAAFVPVSVLWLLVPFPWARWALTIAAAAFTGGVLVLALWPAVRDDPNRLNALGFVLAVFLAHALLALCLKEFFLDEAIPHQGAALPVAELPAPTTAMPVPGNGTRTSR